MSRYKNLFIDLDDTLWDTFHNNKECLYEALYQPCNMERYYPSFEDFFEFYYAHNNQLWAQYRRGEIDRDFLIIDRFRYVLSSAGITETEKILTINKHFLTLSTKKKGLIEGSLDLLDYLRPRYRLFILSNGFREVQSKKLQNSGLSPYFEEIILSEDINVQKPHKDLFDYALRKNNCKLDESMIIGDSWDADIQGGYNAHMDQLWFNPNQEKPRHFNPTYTVMNLLDIKKIL